MNSLRQSNLYCEQPPTGFIQKPLRALKLLFAGVGRNFESGITHIQHACEEMDANALNYQFLIYENNSTDGTRARLADLVAAHPRSTVFSEDLSREEIMASSQARTWDGQPCRMELISHARNRLMALIEQPSYADIDYVILCDLDQTSPLPVALIGRVLEEEQGRFDGLICHGIDERGRMYDTYAYRDLKYPYGPEILGDLFWSKWHQFKLHWQLRLRRKPVPVLSGFNGLCILRKEAIAGLRYSALPEPPLERLNRRLGVPASRGGVNDAELSATLGELGVRYVNNSGYDKPIVCEHVHFFLSMREHGFGRIYLMPKLVWKWRRGTRTIAQKISSLLTQC